MDGVERDALALNAVEDDVACAADHQGDSEQVPFLELSFRSGARNPKVLVVAEYSQIFSQGRSTVRKLATVGSVKVSRGSSLRSE